MNTLDTYVVYLDDAAYAEAQIADVLAKPHTKRFILVACAPRMTRRIGKWLSHSARENWRGKWCDKLFSEFVPHIARQDHVFCEVATGPLPEYTDRLLKDFSGAEVIDARRPKFGVDLDPVTQPAPLESVKAAPMLRNLIGSRPLLA